MDGWFTGVARQRDRDTRVGLINAANNIDSVQSISVDTSNLPDDQSGYWDGSTYVEFFTLGSSELGSTNGLK